jgi:hypothetical protein
VWNRVHVACSCDPDWVGASCLLRAGSTKQHLGYRSVCDQHTLVFARLFLFLHSSHQINSPCTSLHRISCQDAQCARRRTVDSHFPEAGRSCCPLLIHRCFPNIGHIVPSQRRKPALCCTIIWHMQLNIGTTLTSGSQNHNRSTTVTPQLVLLTLALPIFGLLVLIRKGRPALSAHYVACLQLHRRHFNCKHGCCCGKGACDASSHFNTSHAHFAQHVVSWRPCCNPKQAPASMLARSQSSDTTCITTE